MSWPNGYTTSTTWAVCFWQKNMDSPQLHYTDLYKTAADVWSQGVVHDFGIVVLIVGDVEGILCLNCWRHLLTYPHYYWQHLSTYTHYWRHVNIHTTDGTSTYTLLTALVSIHTLLTARQHTHTTDSTCQHTHTTDGTSTYTLLTALVSIHTLLTAPVNIHTLLGAPVNIHTLLMAPVDIHTLFTHKRTFLLPTQARKRTNLIFYPQQKQPTLKDMLFV